MNIECDPEAKPNGAAYKSCIGWKMAAGYGEGCFGMCSKDQRLACAMEQQNDKIKKA